MSIRATGVAFTGYPVSDVDRARHFYGEILGLKCTMDGGESIHWIEYEVGDATLAISNAWAPSGQSGPSVALEVEDFDGAIESLRAQGVTIAMDPIESPVCFMAVIADPDGNRIVIHKLKPSNT